MSKHSQTKEQSFREAEGDIPESREVFYDFDRIEIDDETGQPYPTFMVAEIWSGGEHATENKARRIEYALSLNSVATSVVAETCEVGLLHFVRIEYPSLVRTYVWDEAH